MDRTPMQLSTTTIGSGSRTAALVHGLSASSLHWTEFARLLAEEHDCTVTLVDLRGHGDSPRADRYHLEDFPDDLVDTLPQGLDFLIGQSLGGLSVMLAAERLQPKRLIALEPALKIGPGFMFVLRYVAPFQSRFPDAALRRVVFSRGGTVDSAEAIARIRAGWEKFDPAVRKSLIASVPEPPFAIAPPAVPSTILMAENSLVVRPPVPEQLRAAGWDVREKPGATHEIHVQDPAGVLELLSDLFA
jgi:pimeloyl-ACP methyl ester carboxylesterase